MSSTSSRGDSADAAVTIGSSGTADVRRSDSRAVEAGPDVAFPPADPGSIAGDAAFLDGELTDPALMPAEASSPHTVGPRARPSIRQPGDAPRGRRFNRKAVRIAALVVVDLVCVGLVASVVVKTVNDASVLHQAAAESGTGSSSVSRPSSSALARPVAPTAVPSAAVPVPTSDGPLVAVVGDETVSTAAAGVSGSGLWPQAAGARVQATVAVADATGAGYGTSNASGDTIGDLARRIPAAAEVVVFAGGVHDASLDWLSVAKTATSSFSAASARASGAKIVVVGPLVADGKSDDQLETVRRALRASAQVAGATYVDPIEDGWLGADPPTTAADLSPADERSIATHMESLLHGALG